MPKLTELGGLNSTLTAANAKFQKDLVAVKAEYTDIGKNPALKKEYTGPQCNYYYFFS